MGDLYFLIYAFPYFLNSHQWQEVVTTHSFERGWEGDYLTGYIWIWTNQNQSERAPEIIQDPDTVGVQIAHCSLTSLNPFSPPSSTLDGKTRDYIFQPRLQPSTAIWQFLPRKVTNFPLPCLRGNFSSELFLLPICGLELGHRSHPALTLQMRITVIIV